MSESGRSRYQIRWISKNTKIYLNWAGAERIREDVVKAEAKYRSLQRRYEDDPRTCVKSLRSSIEIARAKIASILNSPSSSKILFTTGSEESLKTVLFSHEIIPWGSRIVTTDCEFFGLYDKIKPPRYQPQVTEIWSASTKERLIGAIVNSISSTSKLLILSHVYYNSGLRLPLAEIIRRCKLINPSLITLVDGAQAVGHIPVNVDEIGCDFYVGDAHKWLLGPDQTGFLYAKDNEHLKILAKDMSSIFSVSPNLNHNKGSRSGAIAYELAALSETIEPFVNPDSFAKISQGGKRLAELFRKGVGEQLSDMFDILPPVPEDLRSNIVCLGISKNARLDLNIDVIHDELLKRDIHCAIIKNQSETNAGWHIPQLLRFCFHYWNSQRDVSSTLSALLKVTSLSLTAKQKSAASCST